MGEWECGGDEWPGEPWLERASCGGGISAYAPCPASVICDDEVSDAVRSGGIVASGLLSGPLPRSAAPPRGWNRTDAVVRPSAHALHSHEVAESATFHLSADHLTAVERESDRREEEGEPSDLQCRAALLTHFWSLEKLATEPCLKTVCLVGREQGSCLDWQRRHRGRSSSPALLPSLASLAPSLDSRLSTVEVSPLCGDVQTPEALGY